ncbi:MAG: AAA domain-containing protein, partial [Candidatus Latescibacteria bacterium]|nr:AAA domain-containing protein [bacterium]MBD3423923.1 AAA domain-containing protein [Candidatus Latescibacterota bacterium]
NIDDCLVNIYEARHLARELGDRNFLRRIRRFRKKIEEKAVSAQGGKSSGSFSIPDRFPEMFSRNSNLNGYLNYILKDLMKKIDAYHGFVSIFKTGDEPMILARRGVSENISVRISDWFRNEEISDVDEAAERVLITNVEDDRRVSGIRDILPGSKAPVYLYPVLRDGRAVGLLFFQSEIAESEPPRLGAIYDVVSTYAGFIGFLIKGIFFSPRSGEAENEPKRGFERVITCDQDMIGLCNLARRVAETDSTVLLMGETGTGKGLLAEAIHDLSPRTGKFVHLNCAALPANLLESELFGHARGAFTGAVSEKRGLFREADGGTAFLDEIGKMPLELQGKLLQFLDSRRVRPVGSNRMEDVDVRLIFASKVDLLELCRKGKMLEDFYYRINDFPMTVPPLRERREDIRLLASQFMRKLARKMKKNIIGISERAMDRLISYDWSGNVRELEKVMNRAVILTEENCRIDARDIIFDSSVTGKRNNAEKLTLPQKVSRLEREVIERTLEANSWNRKAASETLGISYPTLLNKIKKFGLTE